MLKAKTLMLQQQLQQSHARCRRAEQVNGKWRTQLGALRQREKEGWDAVKSGLKKAERAEELQRQNQSLRESVKERGDELVSAGQRIGELEAMREHMRDEIGKATGDRRAEEGADVG